MNDEFGIDNEPRECRGSADDRDAYEVRKLHRTLRGSSLFVWDLGPSTDNGPSGLWASDSYWMAPADRISDLLAWWNLPLAPGVYDVGEDRVEPSERGRPSVDTAYAILRPPSPVSLIPSRVAGAPMCALTEFSTCAVFRSANGPPVLLNVEYLDIVVPGWREWSRVHTAERAAEQESGKPHAQVVFRGADGAVVGCLMPVRYEA